MPVAINGDGVQAWGIESFLAQEECGLLPAPWHKQRFICSNLSHVVAASAMRMCETSVTHSRKSRLRHALSSLLGDGERNETGNMNFRWIEGRQRSKL